jgi:hypothetical protein
MLLRQFSVIALAGGALSSCRTEDPGAGVYYRTTALSAAQAESLQGRLAEAPFRVERVSAKQYGTGVTWGEVQLARGADSAAELMRLSAWMRRQPGVVAVGRDSQALVP